MKRKEIDVIALTYFEIYTMQVMETIKKPNYRNFDESAKKNFIEGAKMAYETIITNFSKGSIKEIKNLLDRKVLNQFQEAISNREKNGIKSETTFIGINSAEIKNHPAFQQNNIKTLGRLLRPLRTGPS